MLSINDSYKIERHTCLTSKVMYFLQEIYKIRSRDYYIDKTIQSLEEILVSRARH